jgi:ParB family transcriptional regulator, chromosome partitioning protein
MRLPWNKTPPVQLDLLSASATDARVSDPAVELANFKPVEPEVAPVEVAVSSVAIETQAARNASPDTSLLLPTSLLFEDPNNPRTDFPEGELTELADDIRQHGMLQPIVVHPANADGRHQIHFGAKRFRAARQAGLVAVPVVVRTAPADPYTQVAENQKRHGLTPLDLARFIKTQVCLGASNTNIAQRLGMNLTTVAHHLALLELPPELDAAMKSGRCTSPRTLQELSKLHQTHPEQINAMLVGNQVITRATLSTLKPAPARPGRTRTPTLPKQISAALDSLDLSLKRVQSSKHSMKDADIATLQQRLADFVARWSQGV